MSIRKSQRGRRLSAGSGKATGRGRLLVESLESRTLLSVSSPYVVAGPVPLGSSSGFVGSQVSTPTYVPSQHGLVNYGGFLSGISHDAPLDIATNFLRTHVAQLGLDAKDLDGLVVTDQTTTALTGTTHLYFRQAFQGLQIANANANVNVDSDGRVISASSTFLHDVGHHMASGSQVLTATGAVIRAAGSLGLSMDGSPVVKTPAVGLAQATTIQAKGVSLDDIPAKLNYIAGPDGVHLAWDLVARTPDGGHWYNTSVDAANGAILSNIDWVDHASYNVYALPSQGPDDSPRTIQTDPNDPIASPYGWQDTNGAPGAEFTDTEGNNVSAQEDTNADDSGGFRPDGGPSLNFDFPIDFTQQPSSYQAAAITNLFYLNNELHDIHYKYGFDEASGNFQVNDYGRGGIGGDQVFADAQDGSGTDNANFATPPDGFSPRMQMYIFDLTSPNRDGDLDNEIVVHEYGHGVSNRLTGGPANSNALDALQSGGMGEGWSDWWSLMLTQKTTDAKNDAYPVGNYVLGESPTGGGIRRFPYSYDMSIDPQTIGDFNGGFPNNEVHNTGELWTGALWDMNWLLIDKYGFNPNLEAGYTGAGSAGNILALQLVMDALKDQPANPSFKDARDAILTADMDLTGGANQKEIWTAFARRGMGLSFVDSDANSDFVIPAFDTPNFNLFVTTTDPAVGTVVSTPPTVFTVNFSEAYDPATVQASDFAVNGIPADSVAFTDSDTLTFTYSTSPVTAQGVQTMSIDPGSILRASDEAEIDAFSGQFRYDAVLLQVTSIVPADGSNVVLPLASVQLNFNEPYDPASIDASDLTLSQGTVTNVHFVDADTVQYDLSGINNEGTLLIGMAAGAVADTFGNPGAAFSASYTLDIGTVPFPTPLGPKPPPGSLIYDPSKSGVIGTAGDTDSFTMLVDSGQKITVTVTPTAPSLRPAVDLYRVDAKGPVLIGSATAGSAGLDAVLQSIATTGPITLGPAPKTYIVTVRAADGTSTGGYTVNMILNAAVESESHGGASNDTIATAQSLDPTLIALNPTIAPTQTVSYPGRAAVLGHIDAGSATVPSIYENNETFSGNAYPITLSPFGISSMRYQQIYSAADFASGGVIDQLKFRRYIYDSTFDDIDLDLEIRLSYAATTVATASPNYADNIGAGAVTVYNGPLHLSSFGFGFPNPFDVVIDVDNTFKYDPSKGDLLVDFFVRSSTSLFASFFSATPTDSQVDTTRIYNFDVNSPVGQPGFTDYDPAPYGLVTQFAFAPDQDNYSFSLKAGESATLVATTLQGGAVNLDLYNAAGTRLATAAGGTINDFFATTTGTYYARISAATSSDYDLVITRNAEFNQEPNDSIATAQDLVTPTVIGQRWAMGSVSGATSPFDLPGTPISGSTILSGDKITLGIEPDGSYIVGPTGIQFLGNEFVQEGSPLAGFTIGRDGLTYTNKGALGTTEIPVTLTDLSNGPLHGVRITGMVGDGLLLERVVLFKDGDEFATVATRLTNLGVSTIHNVAWLENLDPDQGQPATGDFGTDNDVVMGGQLVRASATTPAFPGGLTIGLGSIDSRSVVSAAGFDNRDPFQIINNPQDPNGAHSDIAINLAMNYGDLAAAASVSSIALMTFGRSPAENDATYSAHSGGTVQQDNDFYRVTVSELQTLEAATTTPADQGGEFVNTLDPMLRVYDSAGTLVASDDNSGPNHRNALVKYKVPAGAGGTYYIQVLASTATLEPTKGEYFLSVKQSTGALPAFRVADTTPADGARLRFAPTQITVDFNDGVLLTSLDASDLKVDGVPATAVTIVDSDTATFTLPSVTTDGTHVVTIAAGAVLDLQNTPIQAFSGSFFLDTVAPRVVGISLQEGEVAPAGDLTYVVTFSEAMNTANLDAFDVNLFGQFRGQYYVPDSIGYTTDTTLTIHYTGLPDDAYTLTLFSADFAFEDVVGNNLDGEPLAFPIPPNQSGDGVEGGDFFVHFATDSATRPLPVPLVPVAPSGGLIYQSGTPAVGTIAFAGDTDDYTISLDAGQTLAVFADPAATQQVTITLSDPLGNIIGTATSGGDGQEALLRAVQVPDAGQYTITIGSTGALGLYSVRVLLNADVEAEAHGGGPNSDPGSAQSLDATFTSLGGGRDRAAVLGSIHGSDSPGDVFVAIRSYSGFGGQVNRYDAAGNLVGVIDTPLFDSGVISDAELGPNGDLFIALDLNGNGGDGELIRFDASGGLLGVVPLPSDYFGYYHPFGFDVGSDGTFWVAQPNSGNVVHVDASGFLIASYFIGGNPEDAALAPDGSVYVGDPNYGAIFKLNPSTGTVTPFASGLTVLDLNVTATGDVLAGDFNSGINRYDSAGNLIQFIYQYGVTEPQDSPNGDIWATSYAYGNLTRYDSAGNYLGSIYLPGQPIGLAVVGTDGPATPPEADLYSVTLAAGQSASVVLTGLVGHGVPVDILDGSGTVLATGVADGTNVDASINNFVAPAAGTYYIRITGTGNEDYSLVVTRGADFDVESNDVFATAQDITAPGAALGSVGLANPATTQSLTFDELPFQSVNGLHFKGVTFGYTEFGFPSSNAFYNSFGPGQTVFVNDPSLQGNADGVLTLDFDQPESTIQFGVALNTNATSFAGATVDLYDATDTLIASIPVTTSDHGFFFSEGQFQYTGAPASRAVITFDTTITFNFALDNLMFSSADAEDWYSVSASAGDELTFSTSTPSDGPGEFVNTLDPHIEVYDPTGLLVAPGTPLADGRNEQVTITAAMSGQYRVRVTTEGGSSGEYFLSAQGHTGAPAAFRVSSTDPADGAFLQLAPTTVTVDFNDGVLLTSLQADDLTIDGVPAAGVTVVDGNTAVFTVPGPLSEGSHTVEIAAGAILDLQNTPLDAFAGSFTLDQTPPRIVGISLQQGDVAPVGDLTYTVQFSEPMRIANLDNSDVSLFGSFRGASYTPDSASFDASGTTLTLHYSALPEDNYTLALFSGDGQFEDLAGNDLDGEPLSFPIPPNETGDGFAGGSFFVNFSLDVDTASFVTPLTPKSPPGSLIYDPGLQGLINFAGDTDNYTLNVDAGQTITIVATGLGGLVPTLELRDPTGSPIGSATALPGGVTLLQTVPASAAGIYTITVGGDFGTAGFFGLQVTLNAAVETESYGGGSNGSLGTAQDLDPAFTPLLKTADRAAVLGSYRVGQSIANGSFETGDFSGWAAFQTGSPFVPWTVSAAGAGSGFFPPTSPQDGQFDAWNGFDGSGPMDYVIEQDLAIPSGATVAMLSWKDRLQWDFTITNSATQARTYAVQVVDPGTGNVLATLYSFSTGTTIQIGDTGWQTHSVDLSAFAGQAVRLLFDEFIPEAFTGPGQYELDAVSLAISPGEADYYSLTLAEGQSLSLVGAGLGASGKVELLNSSGDVVATSSLTSTDPTYAGGFAVVGPELTLNGTAQVVGSRLRLNDNFGQASSVFTTDTVDINQFTTQFQFQLSPGTFPLADGITFTIQATGNTAVGGAGDGMGYFGIDHSVAIKFDDFDFVGGGFGASLTGLYQNGEDPGQPSIDLAPSGVDLQSGHVFLVTMGYDGTTLGVTITDTLTHASATQTYVVDIASVIGSTTAYVGFTGGTGGLFGVQEIVDWTFGKPGYQSIDRFVAPSAGTYYIRVTGPADTNYSLVATRDAVFDLDVNDTLDHAQPMGDLHVALGYVGALGDPADYYSFSGAAGVPTHLFTTTPGDGPGEFGNTLDPHLRVLDAAGNVLGVGVPTSDGRNEEIFFTPAADGTYYVEVTAEGGTSGEYILDPSANVAPSAIFTATDRLATPAVAGSIGAGAAIAPAMTVMSTGSGSSVASPASGASAAIPAVAILGGAIAAPSQAALVAPIPTGTATATGRAVGNSGSAPARQGGPATSFGFSARPLTAFARRLSSPRDAAVAEGAAVIEGEAWSPTSADPSFPVDGMPHLEGPAFPTPEALSPDALDEFLAGEGWASSPTDQGGLSLLGVALGTLTVLSTVDIRRRANGGASRKPGSAARRPLRVRPYRA